MTTRLFWQIDKNNVGILTQPVKDNSFAVRSDIERAHCVTVGEMRQLPGSLCCEIEQPEIRPGSRTFHIDQTFSAWQKLITCAIAEINANRRKFDAGAVRTHSPKQRFIGKNRAVVHDKRSIG